MNKALKIKLITNIESAIIAIRIELRFTLSILFFKFLKYPITANTRLKKARIATIRNIKKGISSNDKQIRNDKSDSTMKRIDRLMAVSPRSEAVT